MFFKCHFAGENNSVPDDKTDTNVSYSPSEKFTDDQKPYPVDVLRRKPDKPMLSTKTFVQYRNSLTPSIDSDIDEFRSGMLGRWIRELQTQPNIATSPPFQLTLENNKNDFPYPTICSDDLQPTTSSVPPLQLPLLEQLRRTSVSHSRGRKVVNGISDMLYINSPINTERRPPSSERTGMIGRLLDNRPSPIPVSLEMKPQKVLSYNALSGTTLLNEPIASEQNPPFLSVDILSLRYCNSDITQLLVISI